MFSSIGPMEIFLIVVVILILFGAKKIPELAQGIGKGMKEFKKAVKDVEEDVKLDEHKPSSSSTSNTSSNEKKSV